MARNIVVSDGVERALVKLSIQTGLDVGDVVAHLLATRDVAISTASAQPATRVDTTGIWPAINEIQNQLNELTNSMAELTERIYK